MKKRFIGLTFFLISILTFCQKANPELTKYVDFLEKQNVSAKDYVLGLFKKYDIVILCERQHTETTQYDLIYDIVSSTYFEKNVGNIFTEVGSYSNRQNTLNFIRTKFSNDSLKQIKQAEVYRNGFFPNVWYNTNFYDFTGKLNTLNSTLKNRKQINLFTSGSLNPSVEERKSEQGMKEYLIKNYPKRDSLMASYIIKTFDSLSQYSSRKKALVIMNYRHAFSKSYTKDRNVGDYLFEKYKGKTANVYINYLASLNKFDERDKDKAKMFQGMEQVPIQNGKWDASFKLAGKENLGFNFKNSPFGKDNFDIWTATKNEDKYEDVFTGFVYYLPIEKHINSSGVKNFFINSDFKKIIDDWNLFDKVTKKSEPRVLSKELEELYKKEIETVKTRKYSDLEKYQEIINQWLKY